MAGGFRTEIKKGDEKQAESLYAQMVLAGKLPRELEGDSLQTRMLAIGVMAHALSQAPKTSSANVSQHQSPAGFTYSSLYNPKDLELQQVLTLIASKFSDAIMESRLLDPGSQFDKALSDYLGTHPALTLAIVNGIQKNPAELRKLCQPLGPRHGVSEDSEAHITGFLFPNSLAEKRLQEQKKVFVNIAASLIPFLPELKEHNEKLSEALYSPTTENMLSAAESRQGLPGQLVVAGVLNLAMLPVPWAKIMGGGLKASQLFELALRPGNEELRLVIAGCSRRIGTAEELATASKNILRKDAREFLKMPVQERSELASQIMRLNESGGVAARLRAETGAGKGIANTGRRTAAKLTATAGLTKQIVYTEEFSSFLSQHPGLLEHFMNVQKSVARGREAPGEAIWKNRSSRLMTKDFDATVSQLSNLSESASGGGQHLELWKVEVYDKRTGVARSFFVKESDPLSKVGFGGTSEVKALDKLASALTDKTPDIEVAAYHAGWNSGSSRFVVTDFYELETLHSGGSNIPADLGKQLTIVRANAKELGVGDLANRNIFYDEARHKLIIFDPELRALLEQVK